MINKKNLYLEIASGKQPDLLFKTIFQKKSPPKSNGLTPILQTILSDSFMLLFSALINR